MYKNRFSRTTQKITPNSHPQFFIERSEIAFADTTYIESVLAVLIESRFGPDFVYQKMENPSDRPDFNPVAFSDLLDEGEMKPWGAMPLQGRNTQARCLRSDKFSGTRVSEPGAVATGFLDRNSQGRSHNPTSTLAPNQGRGSP